MRTLFIATMAAVLLAGCASVSVNQAFDPGAAAFINAQGKGTITGQAFLRRNDGVVVYAAGSEVQLMPKTAYTDARVAAMFKGTHLAAADPISGTELVVKNDDPQFKQYVRTTVANGEGRFSFPNVPDGNYYLTAPVIWMVQYAQGGTVLGNVTIANGGSVDVIMNGQ